MAPSVQAALTQVHTHGHVHQQANIHAPRVHVRHKHHAVHTPSHVRSHAQRTHTRARTGTHAQPYMEQRGRYPCVQCPVAPGFTGNP